MRVPYGLKRFLDGFKDEGSLPINLDGEDRKIKIKRWQVERGEGE